MAYRDLEKRRAYQRKWDREHRAGRDTSAYHAEWRKRRDPNLRRDREQEQRFRFREEPPPGEVCRILHTISTRRQHVFPEFIFVKPDGSRRRERIYSIEVFVARMKLEAALSRLRPEEASA